MEKNQLNTEGKVLTKTFEEKNFNGRSERRANDELRDLCKEPRRLKGGKQEIDQNG